MNFFDQYIFHIVVFSPLAASLFIMLIPTSDLGSKLTISKFFSIIGFLAFLRLFVIFLNHDIASEAILSFGTSNFKINLTLFISKYNIFLYGTASAVLLANMFMYEFNDIKTNIHQVSPFLLTFFLNVSFGQNDLRVALPILSIANFLVYFMIGYTDKIRRGSTIFQMGVFLFSCDALALVLLQIPHKNISSAVFPYFVIVLLTPGLARLSLPLLAPFTKKLFLNVDDFEGQFLIIFQQLSGFLILVLIKNDLIEIPPILWKTLFIIATIGVIYIGLIAIFDRKTELLPYYFLVYYSSIIVSIMYLSITDTFWYISISLFTANIACFFFVTRFLIFLDVFYAQYLTTSELRSLYFICLSLLVGIPGIGMGTSLWSLVYQFIGQNILILKIASIPIYQAYLIWLGPLLLLSTAMILSIKEEKSLITQREFSSFPHRRASMVLSPMMIILVCWLIPLATFYASSKGL